MKEGATPKLTTSERESSSLPKGPATPKSRATMPSNKSKTAAKKMKIEAQDAELAETSPPPMLQRMERQPHKRLQRVKILGISFFIPAMIRKSTKESCSASLSDPSLRIPAGLQTKHFLKSVRFRVPFSASAMLKPAWHGARLNRKVQIPSHRVKMRLFFHLRRCVRMGEMQGAESENEGAYCCCSAASAGFASA